MSNDDKAMRTCAEPHKAMMFKKKKKKKKKKILVAGSL
jgi:hypothetical protein